MSSKSNNIPLVPRVLLKTSEYYRLLNIEQELKQLKLSNSTCICSKKDSKDSSVKASALSGGGQYDVNDELYSVDRPKRVKKGILATQPYLSQSGRLSFGSDYSVNHMPRGAELDPRVHAKLTEAVKNKKRISVVAVGEPSILQGNYRWQLILTYLHWSLIRCRCFR